MVELMGVMVVIGILAGITLGGAGAVRRHAAASQTKTEIAALEAACTRFQADNGFFPSNVTADPTTKFNPSDYQTAGRVLFTNLFGTNLFSAGPTGKRYFEPKPSMVSSTTSANPFFVDPWGYAYGYYSDGSNTPVLWSTAGQITRSGTNKWITSWPRN